MAIEELTVIAEARRIGRRTRRDRVEIGGASPNLAVGCLESRLERTAWGRGQLRQGCSIGSDGLRIPEAWTAVMDVLFDEERVWSFAPGRDAVGSRGRRLVPWPDALRPCLDGIARVTVREHVTGRTVADGKHRFGAGDGHIRVVDAAGRPLAVNKLGHLQPTFDAVGLAAAGPLLDQVAKVLAILRDECGLPAFVSSGALLGAVRDGRLISHDCDMDVSYLSRQSHPADVARESYRIERALHRHRLRHRRFSMADFKVLGTDADGVARDIDVRGGFYLDETLYLMPNVRAPLPQSAILPLGEVELDGRRFPAPADPEALLEATYGPGWRVPDPSFKFAPPPSTSRRLDGWMGGRRTHLPYWNVFYRSRARVAAPRTPSPFARWVSEHDPVPASLVDIGSGDGRDALWFAGSGRHVLGLDYAFPAITKARAAAKAGGLSAEFTMFNLYDLRQVLVMGARLAAEGRPRTLYGRFLVHALGDDGRRHLWRLAEMALRAGGRLYLEFRTDKDAEAPHVFDEPFRRFLDPDVVVDEIEARGGHVEYREEGHGLAPFRDEDPHVCRLVVGWQR